MPVARLGVARARAYLNVFAIESFMDEAADAAGIDPVDFRLNHLGDARARDVITKARRNSAGRKMPNYRAAVARVSPSRATRTSAPIARWRWKSRFDRETGIVKIGKVVAAVDSGQAVNHDGIRNQIEGAIVQSSSWTRWRKSPSASAAITRPRLVELSILRFPDMPDSVDVHVIDRPDQPFLGTGEAGQGPTGAAIANGVARATACASAICRSIRRGEGGDRRIALQRNRGTTEPCALTVLPPCLH